MLKAGKPILIAAVIALLMTSGRAAHAVPYSQDWVLAKGLLIRLLMLPIDPFVIGAKELIASRYGGIEKKTKEKRAQDALMPDASCGVWQNQAGKAESDRCSCEQVCPETFDILSQVRPRMEPRNENLLQFLNEDEDYDDVHPRTLGYCWAHTTVLRDFNFLAFFDPDNSSHAKIPDPVKQPKQWLKFYRKLIKKILRHEAVVIPGFKNLWEFSAHEVINHELKVQTVKTWRKKAVNLQSLPLLLRSTNDREMTRTEAEMFIAEVRERLALNQTPKMWFTHQEDWKTIHVVPVYEVREDAEGVKLCFIDNHVFEEGHIECSQHVVLRPDGSLYYKEWDFFRENRRDVRVMGFTPEDRLENVRFVEQLTQACRVQTSCR